MDLTRRFFASLAVLAFASLACGCQHQQAKSASHRAHPSQASRPVHLHGISTGKSSHASSPAKHTSSGTASAASTAPVWAGELD